MRHARMIRSSRAYLLAVPCIPPVKALRSPSEVPPALKALGHPGVVPHARMHVLRVEWRHEALAEEAEHDGALERGMSILIM